MKKSSCLPILLLLSFSTIAQVNLDSLWNIWNDKTNADTIRLEAVHYFIQGGVNREFGLNQIFIQNPDSLFVLTKLVSAVTASSGNKKYELMEARLRGVYYQMILNYPETIKLYTQALEMARVMENKRLILLSMVTLAIGEKAWGMADGRPDSARLSAQELVGEINFCFEAFDNICSKYNVEKIKTIGDAYMAAGGLPVPNAEAAKNTVLAALEMQQFIADRKAKQNVLGKPAFEMRVGIHTGPVVAGIVGVKKFQYDIWGDTVNTASRLESNGEVGRVNISQSTYDAIKDEVSFTFEKREKIQVKGKGEMEMYFVT